MRNIPTLNDVHQQFAEYFDIPALKPYAYLLSKKGSEGHICLHLDKIAAEKENLPESYQKIETSNQLLESIPLVGTQGNDKQPFVIYQNRLYLQRYFRYETEFLQRIRDFLVKEKTHLPERIALLQQQQPLISKLFAGTAGSGDNNDPADWQLAAAITGVLNNFTIITGGPGTGKTTTVAKILAILFATDPALKVALAAPTGKAAARMAESLRNTTIEVDAHITEKFRLLQPATIHRLLKSINGSPYFRHNKDNPLNYDVVIIDECSMIDVALFAKLLDAIHPDTRLILLGDKDQLASVEAGSLFGDLCQAQEHLNRFTATRRQLINSFMPEENRHIPATAEQNDDHHPLFQHLVELRRSHRFTGNKGIGKFSKAIISNNVRVITSFFPPSADEQVIVDPEASVPLFEDFIAGYAAFIAEKDITTALKLLNAQRVLTAVREGPQGLYAVNKQIEKYLSDKKLITTNTEFYENRPVILTRNYYEHGLFNGDTGIIRADENGVLLAWFEDSTGALKTVLPGYLTQAETAFAMTIHKSQGSEFGEVLVLLPDTTDVPILTRELLYTAVSRAKNKVYVQGTPEVILMAAERFVERASGIASRFREVNTAVN
ncbi:exodeoxyribonuclease V subunit alpha [Chitinophaga ginsengisegetis]|uniref:exodeoxyribonuclease V subunit alpha n=1 Tax=Chitinophaga ginsengisegetis TaxID=393003 RepID=UPI000DC01FBF|nr:exodeoxyribonuclease V subunit alpha [Chitinophaga ginsengisegetis]MDR6566031.1 exodeoxyribonuclease V alpha subunit [Chitinophaga ginsengisegetis]MDR6645760.1 exodeoxyribonuclease V alpha subunit [Chitinophaga ginsengisegetis]MDR6651648.1 exodeoxyribonuclease V alpha subunit [Chitinophaga ginsengisegetis]